MKKMLYCIGLLVIIIMLCGCTTRASDKNAVGTTEITIPIDYGNGVLYFNCKNAEFGNSLSSYINNNPSMKVVSISSSDGNTFYGEVMGYFVVVEKR